MSNASTERIEVIALWVGLYHKISYSLIITNVLDSTRTRRLVSVFPWSKRLAGVSQLEGNG
jgi:uncharacterized membrane protein